MIALMKLGLVFSAIVLLLRRKWNLGLVLVLASAAIGLLFGHPLSLLWRDALLASIDPLTLRLAVIVVLIMTLGELLRETGGLEGMVEALQALIPRGRVVIAALPALVGLLPMVGGAMFSAPMVDAVGDRLSAGGAHRTFVNYWFRHAWEPVLPLYPSALLAAALLGLTAAQLAATTWPLTAAMVAGGLLFGLLRLRRQVTADPPSVSPTASLRTLATSIWPIALVIGLSLSLHVDGRLDLILALLVTITLTMVLKRVPLGRLGTILRRRIPWNTVVVICGAMIFRRVLESSSAVLAVSDALIDLHVPPAAVAFTVPFIVGMLTGIVVAAYSIGFPIALPLVAAAGAGLAPAWTVWMMAGGFLGVMCSPLHLCLALTRVYFETDWGAIYRLIVPAALLVVAVAGAVLVAA